MSLLEGSLLGCLTTWVALCWQQRLWVAEVWLGPQRQVLLPIHWVWRSPPPPRSQLPASCLNHQTAVYLRWHALRTSLNPISCPHVSGSWIVSLVSPVTSSDTTPFGRLPAATSSSQLREVRRQFQQQRVSWCMYVSHQVAAVEAKPIPWCEWSPFLPTQA